MKTKNTGIHFWSYCSEILCLIFFCTLAISNIACTEGEDWKIPDTATNLEITGQDTFFVDIDVSMAALKMFNEITKETPKLSKSKYENIMTILKSDRYIVVPLCEFDSTISPDKVVVGLRHDVDGNIFAAAGMAQTEQDFGFRSTYYILQSSPYFGYRREHCFGAYRANIDIVKEISALGHEIGDHNGLFVMQVKTGINPVSFMLWWHEVMAAEGVNIVGSASHGDGECHDWDCMNREIFAGCTNRTSIEIPDHGTYPFGWIELSDVGLDYEAYSLDYNVYLSDASGFWKDGHDPETYLDSIAIGKRVVILMHPDWWDF